MHSCVQLDSEVPEIVVFISIPNFIGIFLINNLVNGNAFGKYSMYFE
jgi:hypothetical protein